MRRGSFLLLTAVLMVAVSSGVWLLGVKASGTTPLPVTGNLSQILGTPAPYAGLTLQLANCPSPITIAGYNVIVQTTMQVQANASGLINTSVWGNDIIDCNGTTGNSQYMATFSVNGVPQGESTCYQVLSTQGQWNLNTQQPINCSQTPPDPQDASYRNITSSSFFQGANGAMSGTWQASSFTDTGLAADVGECVLIQSGGLYGAIPCGSGSGITQLTGDGTAGPGTGSQAFTLKTVNSGPGSCGDGTHVCAVTVNGKGLTTAQSQVAISFPSGTPYASPGIVFGVNSSTARVATGSDLTALLGGTPLLASNNLNDVSNAMSSLSNLFFNAGVSNTVLLGIGPTGAPLPTGIGSGLQWGWGSGTAVVGLSLSGVIPNGSSCPTGVVFTGGGGSGATATVTCGVSHGTFFISTVMLTAGGSYTSPPTVGFTGAPGFATATVTAILGGSPVLSTTAVSNTATLVSGTVTVSNAAACTPGATCSYKLTHCGTNSSAAIGTLSTGTIVPGTSFVINALTSTNTVATGDVSNVCWQVN